MRILKMSEIINLANYQEARDFYANSGLVDWEWFKEFDEEELINFLYRNSNGRKTFDYLLKEFLINKNEDTAGYF
jgi:hypothetical protein